MRPKPPPRAGTGAPLHARGTISRAVTTLAKSYAAGVADKKIGPETRDKFYDLMHLLGVRKTQIQTRLSNGESALTQLQHALELNAPAT